MYSLQPFTSLKCWGVLADLVLQRNSPYHSILAAAEESSKGKEGADEEWGGVSFDSVETLCVIAGARLSLAEAAGENIWLTA